MALNLGMRESPPEGVLTLTPGSPHAISLSGGGSQESAFLTSPPLPPPILMLVVGAHTENHCAQLFWGHSKML